MWISLFIRSSCLRYLSRLLLNTPKTELLKEYHIPVWVMEPLRGGMALPEEKRPGACVGCRSCEAVCPQQIKISEAMKDFAGKMKG